MVDPPKKSSCGFSCVRILESDLKIKLVAIVDMSGRANARLLIHRALASIKSLLDRRLFLYLNSLTRQITRTSSAIMTLVLLFGYLEGMFSELFYLATSFNFWTLIEKRYYRKTLVPNKKTQLQQDRCAFGRMDLLWNFIGPPNQTLRMYIPKTIESREHNKVKEPLTRPILTILYLCRPLYLVYVFVLRAQCRGFVLDRAQWDFSDEENTTYFSVIQSLSHKESVEIDSLSGVSGQKTDLISYQAQEVKESSDLNICVITASYFIWRNMIFDATPRWSYLVPRSLRRRNLEPKHSHESHSIIKPETASKKLSNISAINVSQHLAIELNLNIVIIITWYTNFSFKAVGYYNFGRVIDVHGMSNPLWDTLLRLQDSNLFPAILYKGARDKTEQTIPVRGHEFYKIFNRLVILIVPDVGYRAVFMMVDISHHNGNDLSHSTILVPLSPVDLAWSTPPARLPILACDYIHKGLYTVDSGCDNL
ncbi:hypothetical protein C0J52_18991 [Blattella germanica]|nr:hypothetical protein C0J52_18991 [Blattella germanica]